MPSFGSYRILALATLPAMLFGQSVTMTEFPIPTPDSRPAEITTGPDGALWFAEFGTNKIGRITIQGTITEFSIPTPNSQPNSIVAGPDGALWFTEALAKQIGRITTSGVVTEFPCTGNPNGITVGPDGALWFTQNNSGKIGRITTSGILTEFDVVNTEAQGITTGADGALWFTETSASRIGRITTAGVVTKYSPPLLDRPDGITSGPDGALWFVGLGIARITTQGVITQFNKSGGFNITTGPDGALWYACGRLCRITTDGTATTYPMLNPASEASAIAVGPDGALWITDKTRGRIARAAISSGTPCTFSLPQASQTFTAAGGSGTATVRAVGGCAWTAGSTVPWITLTTGSSGSGNGTVTYTVAANPSAASRFGTIIIANQLYTVVQAGTAAAVNCTASAPLATQISLEGRTEKTGDYLLNCSGLTGALTADITLSLNANVTNPLAGGATDAILTVNGGSPKNGVIAGYNSLRWPGVTLVPANGGTAALRITNVRVDASVLASLGNLQAAAITAQASISALSNVPVTNGLQSVASASQSLAFTKGQANPPAGGAQTSVPLVFQEARTAGFQTNTTRLRMVLTGVPATAQVYAPVFAAEGASRAQLYSADFNGLGGSPLAGTPFAGGVYQQLTISQGVGSATWVVLADSPSQVETWTFPLLVLNASAGDLGKILVSGSLAPVSEVSLASAVAPVPRYRDFSTPQKLVNLRISTSLQVQGSGTALKPSARNAADFSLNGAVQVGSNVTSPARW